MIDMSKCLKSQRVVLKYWLIHIRLTCREKVGGSQRIPLLTKRKDNMSLETRLIKLKMKYDKLALREPMSGQQVLDRMIWERLKRIMIKRYGRYD